MDCSDYFKKRNPPGQVFLHGTELRLLDLDCRDLDALFVEALVGNVHGLDLGTTPVNVTVGVDSDVLGAWDGQELDLLEASPFRPVGGMPCSL